MPHATLYFCGSGHGGEQTYDTDSMVQAYDRTRGVKALFPGPGAKDVQVYVSPECAAASGIAGTGAGGHGTVIGANCRNHGWGASAVKRGVTGKGWNDNAALAVRLIAGLLENNKVPLKLNIVGHSRGSITVLMLLNDLFFAAQPAGQNFSMTLGGRKFLKDPGGFFKKSKQTAPAQNAADWHEKQLTSIWSRRIGAAAAAQTVGKLRDIHAGIQGITDVNCFLFDPVGGPFGGDSDRQKALPEFSQLKRFRVLRMEHGGFALNSNMPTFGVGTSGSLFVMMSGERSVNLLDCPPGERYVIPLPGSHGAGVSRNKGKTSDQQYIGTSYMAAFLDQSGTKFEAGFLEQFGDETEMLAGYERLAAAFKDKLPSDKDRQAIASHHTKNGYKGGKVNAHHQYLYRAL